MNYCMVQKKNKKKVQSYRCKDETCEWKIYFALVLHDGQTFECKSGHFIHTCESTHGLNHPLANARWVAKVMLECYKAHPNYKPRDFITEVKKNHKVDISYFTAWHAFHLCNEKIMGSYEEGYSLLPALCDQIKGENNGFVKNRPILGLDGCHLTGKYGGVLLAITSLDGNNGLFPIAIYICLSECKESWIDFLSIMAEELKKHPMALTFISDRQKGLIEGVSRNFSDVNHSHRYCFRHLYKNFKKSHPGKNLEFIVWRAARSFSEVGHKIWMDRLKEAKPSTPECVSMLRLTSVEAFNSWILDYRKMPVCKLVQKFHFLMMRIFFDREQVGEQMPDGGVVPRVTDIMKKHLYFSHEFTKQPSTKHLWSVSDTKKDISWVVNLEEHTCTCNAWKVCGIPCVHGICASLFHRTKNHDKYVHEYMFVDTYRKLYAPSIEPLLDKALWAVNPREVKPPKCSRPPGRPRSQRRRDKDDGGNNRKYMCGKCYVYGHNRVTCKGAAAEDQHQAPATFTGPHVRPNPAFRPPPPPPTPATTSNSTTTSAPRNGPRTRGGGTRKRRGGATTSAPTSTTVAPSSVSTASTSTTPEEQGPAKRGRVSSTPAEPVVQVQASTIVAFGRGVATINARGGRPRGRGSRANARGRIVHRRHGEIVGVGILQAEPPTLRREPTLAQVFNTGRGGGRVGRGGGGLVTRGGGIFSSSSGRGSRRLMDWLGTPEQWANDEN
ncbi:hypothetical protein MKW92_040015 [Papaver armeniacum]|nr:hypothetical protein MKW92_040015 [Papaver armeniacum]